MLGYSIAGFLFAFLASLRASAQSLSPCVEQCALQALPEAGCNGLSDLECVCSSNSSKNLVYECLQMNCPNELNSGEVAFNSACMGNTTYSSTASGYSTSASTSHYTNITSTPYNTTTPTVYSTSASAMNTGYTSISGKTVPPPSSSAPASTSSTGAVDRSAVPPVAFVELMAAMVAMTML